MNPILERLRQEETLAKNGDKPILERSFPLAIGEIERLQSELSATVGHLLNAAIDLETGAPKRTALATINGGINCARGTLSHQGSAGEKTCK